MSDYMGFATYGKAELTTDRDNTKGYWPALGKQLAASDRKRAKRQDAIERQAKAEQQRQANAAELRQAVEAVVKVPAPLVAELPHGAEKLTADKVRNMAYNASDILAQAGAAIDCAKSLGMVDRVFPDPTAFLDYETDAEHWERLAAMNAYDVCHDEQLQTNECFPFQAAWRVKREEDKAGNYTITRDGGDLEHFAYRPPVLHHCKSGLVSIASAAVREPIPNIFSLPAFDRLGGAELQPGLIVNAPKPHGDIVADQIETIAQDALEDIEAICNPNTSFMERIEAVCRLGRVVQYRQQRRKQFTPDPKTVEQRNQEARQARVAAYLQSH